MTKQEFAQKIKEKYPQYKNVDDNTLADKMLEKYPEYRSKVDEKSILRKVGDFFTSSAQKFGNTLGTAASTIDPVTKKLRSEVIASSNSQSDNYIRLAKETTDKAKKANYLKAAQKAASIEGVDIFNNPEYQKTAKQIIGEAAGTALEIASFGTYGKGATAAMKSGQLSKATPTAIKTLLTPGKQITKAAKEGAKVGSIYGGLYSSSEAMQNNASNVDIIKGTLVGAGTGALGGAVLGGGISAIGAGTSAALKKGNELTKQAKVKLGKLAEKKLNQTATDLVKMSPTMSKAEAKWGKNTPKFIIDEGVLPLIDNDGKFLKTGEAVSALKTKYNAESNAFNKLLDDSGEYVSLDKFKQKVIDSFGDDLKAKGSDYEDAINYVLKEIQSYKKNYLKKGIFENGDVLVKVSDFNKIKSGLWSKTSNFNPTQKDKLLSDLNYQMGHTAKDIIEETISDVSVKDLNKRLGDFAQAIKVLENAEGKVVPGGFFGKQFTRLAGTVAGTGGGVVGSILGNITGGVLADIVSNPKIRTGVWTKVYQKLNKTQGGKSIIQEAQKILEKRGNERAKRLLLEAPKYIPLKGKSDSSRLFTQEEAQALLDSFKKKNINTKLLPKNNLNNKLASKSKPLSSLREEAKKYKSAEEAKKLGYDGVDWRGQSDGVESLSDEIRVWNTDKIKTKSQLTDIWNKANKKTPLRK